ncbi:MAG: M23 family metallopeptidase [Coriobacteriia bacterium]
MMRPRRSRAERARMRAETRRARVRVVVLGAGVILIATVLAFGVRTRAKPDATSSPIALPLRAAPASAAGTKTSDVAGEFFATIAGTHVGLVFPATSDRLVAVGFHEASRPEALVLVPEERLHTRARSDVIKAALARDPGLKLFEMNTRDRATAAHTALDCAVLPGTTVRSPVDGTVRLVKRYYLEGRWEDRQIEIELDGAPGVRVVMIHVRDVRVRAGTRVRAGVTPIGRVRHLLINSQVNRYLPVAADHTHIQVNPVSPSGAPARTVTGRTG